MQIPCRRRIKNYNGRIQTFNSQNNPTKTPALPTSTQPSITTIQQICQNQQIGDEPDQKFKKKKSANWSKGLGLSLPENSWPGKGGRGLRRSEVGFPAVVVAGVETKGGEATRRGGLTRVFPNRQRPVARADYEGCCPLEVGPNSSTAEIGQWTLEWLMSSIIF